jgi:epoxyqueuosine reductase QueG
MALAFADTIDAASVKRLAKDLGADLVGIADADILNAHPPDPKVPQTPQRISPFCRSVIVIACRIPVAGFRAKSNIAVQYLDMVVLRRMDRIAYEIADTLERAGHPTFTTAAQETDWEYKKASYGRLSTRHLGVEAGLGTLGLDVNILTPEFGPRVYLTGILTEAQLEADGIRTDQVCIGETCSRCLHACPADAVAHWGLKKSACATCAQEYGYMTATNFFLEFIGKQAGAQREAVCSRRLFGFWQGLLRVVGSFGDCPRCLAVCPVGDDYHAHLAGPQKVIPEKTAQKVARGKAQREARAAGEDVPGLNGWNIRWVGPNGYKGGSVARSQRARQASVRRAQTEER